MAIRRKLEAEDYFRFSVGYDHSPRTGVRAPGTRADNLARSMNGFLAGLLDPSEFRANLIDGDLAVQHMEKVARHTSAPGEARADTALRHRSPLLHPMIIQPIR